MLNSREGYVPMHHAMKMHRCVVVKCSSFLTVSLDGSKWLALLLTVLPGWYTWWAPAVIYEITACVRSFHQSHILITQWVLILESKSSVSLSCSWIHVLYYRFISHPVVIWQDSWNVINVCASVCACAHTCARVHAHAHIHLCMDVCMCVYVSSLLCKRAQRNKWLVLIWYCHPKRSKYWKWLSRWLFISLHKLNRQCKKCNYLSESAKIIVYH
jgi:hypothetical protein